MEKDSLKLFQVKLQNLPVETKQIVNSPALYVSDPPEKLDKYHWNGMSFPTEFLSGATCNGTHKANITAIMTNTWLNSDQKVTQTEGTHTHIHVSMHD